jgi:hypothetical protein
MPYPWQPFDGHKMNVGQMWVDKVNQKMIVTQKDVATKTLYNVRTTKRKGSHPTFSAQSEVDLHFNMNFIAN